MCSRLSIGDRMRWRDFLFRWKTSTCSRKPLNYSASNSVQHNNIANPQTACFIRAILTFRYANAECHESAHQTRCEHVHICSEQHLLEPLAFVSPDDDSSECWNFLSRTRQVETWKPENYKTSLNLYLIQTGYARSAMHFMLPTNTVMAHLFTYCLFGYLLVYWLMLQVALVTWYRK